LGRAILVNLLIRVFTHVKRRVNSLTFVRILTKVYGFGEFTKGRVVRILTNLLIYLVKKSLLKILKFAAEKTNTGSQISEKANNYLVRQEFKQP
jgi:hypothetical protein